MSYAVIATGGKQYRVAPGDEVTIERLNGEVGDAVELDAVMLVGDGGDVTVGKDAAGKTIKATITGHDKGPKIRVFTYKNKSRQHKRGGHRQMRTTVKIDSI